MYRPNHTNRQTLKVGSKDHYEGITLEDEIIVWKNNKEPIPAVKQVIFTERKDGVNPNHNIRTNRWEHAAEITDYQTRSALANRQFRQGERTFDTMKPEEQKKHIENFPHSKYNTGTQPS